MAQDPEAKVYDAEVEEFDLINKELYLEIPDETWGKIGTILEQARQIAAQQE